MKAGKDVNNLAAALLEAAGIDPTEVMEFRMTAGHMPVVTVIKKNGLVRRIETIQAVK